MDGGGKSACSGCGDPLDAHNEGIELWGSRFCSTCFIGRAAPLGKELSAEEAEALRKAAGELSGFLPPELVEMVLVGFHRRSAGDGSAPSKAELARATAEIQRLTAFACVREILKLLKAWEGTFSDFVRDQEEELRRKIRALSDWAGSP